MTGFGTGRLEHDAGVVTVQLAVVNHRYCQVQVRCDPRSVALEHAIRARVQDGVLRGSATVQVEWVPRSRLAFDTAALAASWRELADLAGSLGAPPPALEQVARLQQRSAAVDLPLIQPLIEAAVDQALAALDTMRLQEGAALQTECCRALDALDAVRVDLDARAAERVAVYGSTLLERVREAVGERADIGADDLVREVALQADRIDVREELVRLEAHTIQLRDRLADTGPVGKQIEFLLQEVGREVNTVGSKANDAALTALVCQAKHIAEQMREQVANCL